MEGKQELTYKNAIVLLKEYIQSTGKKQTDVAAELGVSGALVSSFLAGTYKTPHTMVPKVEELVRLNEKKKVTPKEPDFAETSVSRTVFKIGRAHV